MRRSLPVFVFAAATVAITLACKGKFEGPYPCAAGFASCTTATACETETSSDGSHCGSCGHSCAPGAACTNGSCGSAPLVFEATPSPTYLTLSPSSLVAWVAGGSSGSPTVIVVPATGGTVTPVPAPFTTCGSASPFAIDSSSIYFVAAVNGGGAVIAQALPGSGPVDAGPDACGALSTCCSGGSGSGSVECDTVAASHLEPACNDALGKLTLSGYCPGARTPLAPGVGCATLAVSDGTLYYASQMTAGSGPGGATFFSVPTVGGTPRSIGSEEGWSSGALVVSQGSLYFGPSCEDNGPCGDLGILSTSGGSPTYTAQIGNSYGGQGALTSDSTGVYLATSGWDCGNGDGGVPAVVSGGTTVALIASGGRETVLATTHDGSPVTSIAVDSSNVYWISGVNAWSAPKSGGTAIPIAGNLGVHGAALAAPCASMNGGTSSASPSLVSDGTYVYIADPSENAIYRVPVP